MNALFLQMTGALAARVLVLTVATAILLTHISFALAKLRRSFSLRYIAFMKRWLLLHALPSAIALTLLVILFATVPVAILSSYRTRTIHNLGKRELKVRVHGWTTIPLEDGRIGDVYALLHTTTNAIEISELLRAIRLSPTYPGAICMCRGDRKFEIMDYDIYGRERTLQNFTVHHDQNIRVEQDWYGDWHLWPGSQRDLAAWQRKYVDREDR